ncbi:rRNA processing protein [Rhizina undulata]
MGSSNKKKKEKAKDFAKPKLKVGKTKPKAANFTDTSFKSKGIVLASQSLHASAPTTSYLFAHHLSLLKHHSASTRKESLSYLTTHLPAALSSPQAQLPPSSTTASAAIPTTATLIPTIVPLILDSASSVRTQLLTLLKTLPEDQVKMHAGKIMLYVNSAMTHISEDVRGDSTKFLSWILSLAPEEVFRGGGWGKGLWGLVGVLGWGGRGPGEGGKVSVPQGKDRKVVFQHLAVLKEFLLAGIVSAEEVEVGEDEVCVPHWSTGLHMLPSRSNAFAYLNLFSNMVKSNVGVSGAGETMGEPEDLDARRRYLRDGPGKGALGFLRAGLEGLRKEGGEAGRIAGKVVGVLDEGLEAGTGMEE